MAEMLASGQSTSHSNTKKRALVLFDEFRASTAVRLAPPFHMVLPVVRGGAAISTTASVLPSLLAKKDPAKTTDSRIVIFFGTCCSPARAQIPGASAALTPPRSTRKKPPAGDAAPQQVASIRVSAHGVPHRRRSEGSARAALLEARAFFVRAHQVPGCYALVLARVSCTRASTRCLCSRLPARLEAFSSCDCALATRRRGGSAARVRKHAVRAAGGARGAEACPCARADERRETRERPDPTGPDLRS